VPGNNPSVPATLLTADVTLSAAGDNLVGAVGAALPGAEVVITAQTGLSAGVACGRHLPDLGGTHRDRLSQKHHEAPTDSATERVCAGSPVLFGEPGSRSVTAQLGVSHEAPHRDGPSLANGSAWEAGTSAAGGAIRARPNAYVRWSTSARCTVWVGTADQVDRGAKQASLGRRRAVVDVPSVSVFRGPKCSGTGPVSAVRTERVEPCGAVPAGSGGPW
jgi:hypothetical protein